jgi:SOS response regulatory protein OraA/RecX
MAATARSSNARREAQARRARRASVTDSDEVMEAGAAFLSVRPRSVAETRGRLRHLGYPGSIVDVVVERLVSLAFLDDRAFSRWWVESRDRARPRGVMALRRELQRRACPATSSTRCWRTCGKYLGPGPGVGLLGDGSRCRSRASAPGETWASPTRVTHGRQRQRAYALLARHGFTPDVCRIVAAGSTAGDELIDEEADAFEAHV